MSARGATLVLIGATAAVSFSAIFIRVAGDNAATIVWLRMAIATVLLAPWVLARRRRARIAASERGIVALVVASGVLLAGHFLLWTASLTYTSVASSVLLVSLHPLIVAPLGRRLLGDRMPRQMIAGIVLALTGTAITCIGGAREGSAPLLGDLLALGGAVCLAGYLLIGRGVRAHIDVLTYSTAAFAVVSATAVAAAAASGGLHVPGARALAACTGLAVVCTIGGHVAYNRVLRGVPAATVSVAFLGEPPLTALLAFALLGSSPSAATTGGGALILAGLALTLLIPHQRPVARGTVALE